MWSVWEAEFGLSRTPGEAMRLAVKSVRQPQGSDSLTRCVRGRSDSTRQSNAFSREISQTALRIGLPHPVCAESGRPNLGSLIGSDRSHDKCGRLRGKWEAKSGRPRWEAEVGGRGGRPKVEGCGRPCSPDWLSNLMLSVWANERSTASHGLPQHPTASHGLPLSPRPPTFTENDQFL